MALSRVALVVVYFGRLPNYFPLYVHTAARNPTIDFKFFGDSPNVPASLPSNVTFTPITIEEVRLRAEKVLGFKPVLPGAYKLCDYKVIYGLLFAQELAGYDFWGHVDIDMVLGNLRMGLTEETLRSYLRIFMSGHLSVYRNSDESNNLFRLQAPGVDYRQVYTDPRNRIFDEWEGMYKIHLHHKIPYYFDASKFCDSTPLRASLATQDLPPGTAQLFGWDDGKLIQWYVEGGNIKTREFMYLHLQKRAMLMQGSLEEFQAARRWYITGTRFIPADDRALGEENFHQLDPSNRFTDFRHQAIRPWKKVRRLAKEWLLLRRYGAPRRA